MPKSPFKTKICTGCAIEKPRSEYYKKGATVSHKCKPCSLADIHSRAPKYFGKYAEYQNSWRKNRYSSDVKYREKMARQKKAAYDKNKSALNAARRFRWKSDPRNPARLYYRRKDVKDKTPKWASKELLLEIHAKCPKGMEVDHVIPLRGLIDGRPVSGLHVPCNLQYLSVAKNRQKKNRISESDL